jgi:hypothetical protein
MFLGTPERAHASIEAVLRHEHILRWLTPPASVGRVVLRDVVAHSVAQSGNLEQAVHEWALGAWLAWDPWHDQIREWYRALDGLRR